MRAILLGLVLALIVAASVPGGAGAARKRAAQDAGRPPQDSVLWIPRVAKPPDLGALLTAIGLREQDGGSSRAAKVQRDPAGTESDAPSAKGEKLEKPAADTLTSRRGRPEKSPVSPDFGTGAPDGGSRQDAPAPSLSGTLAPPRAGPEAGDSSRGDSLSKASITPPKPPGGASLAPLLPPRPSRHSFASGPADVATASPRREAPAVNMAPAGPARTPAARDVRGADRVDFVFRLFAPFAGAFVLGTGLAWFLGRRRLRSRHAPDPLSEAAPGGHRNGKGNGVAGLPAKNGRGRSPGVPARVRARSGLAPGSRVRRLFVANLGRVKGSLLLAAFFMLGGAAVELLKPWPLKVILDHVILSKPFHGPLSFLEGIAGNRIDLLIGSTLAIVVISLLGGVFSYFEVFITKAIGIRMVYTLRREVFSHLQRLSLSFHNRAQSGDLLTTFAKDTSTLKDVFAEALLRFSDHFLSVAGMLAILWWVNWKMALIALASLPFLCFTLWHLYRQTKLSLKRQRKQDGKVTSRMNEVLAAVPLVQAFSREKHEEERYEEVSRKTLRESIRMTRLEAAATRSSQILSAVGTAATVLFGATEVLRGNMLPGDLVLVMSYLTAMYKPLRQLSKLSIDISKAAASADRIAQVLEVEPEIRDLPDAIDADHVKGRIVFSSVSFDYGDGRDVLRGVSFEVEPGQRLALVGVSGAGKSTIASLVLRLYEAQSGAIRIDDVDIERYRREALRRQIGIVLQQSVLFGATIRENIAYGKPDASQEEIVAAAVAANADEFIRRLEGGYDSVIGERGVTLSAGQRQRIAIARAVIRNPRILILDEPMSGLDAESEFKVRQALERLMVGKTTIMITHDLQSIADADQVLLLDDGRIAERGSHIELIRRSGRYCELFDLGRAQHALTGDLG